MKIEGNAHVLDMNVPKTAYIVSADDIRFFSGGDQFGSR